MHVISNLVNLYNSLSNGSTYRAAIKTILVNLRSMSNLTIYETAELSAASRTTIWRMVKLMGYKSFSDFNHALSKAVSRYTFFNRIDMGIATPDISKCIDKVYSKVQNCLTTLQNIDLEYTKNIVEVIHSANRVGFYGFNGDPYIHDLQMNLSMSGKQTNLFTLLPDMLEDAATTDKDTVTIIRAIEFIDDMDLDSLFLSLKKQGGKIILLYIGSESRYKKYADLTLNDMYKTPEKSRDVITVIVSIAIINEIYRGCYL